MKMDVVKLDGIREGNFHADISGLGG